MTCLPVVIDPRRVKPHSRAGLVSLKSEDRVESLFCGEGLSLMTIPKIKSTAILIGYNSDGKCVYSTIVDLSDYYDGEHVWDKSAMVKRLKLQRLKGFLFDSNGTLDQEFESVFDLTTGIYKSGSARYADGTIRKDE